jgi:endonuclease III
MAGRFWSAIARLRARYGPMRPFSRDPFALIVYENAAYLADDDRRLHAFQAIDAIGGMSPAALLRAPRAALVDACRIGGMAPDVRADRLRRIAELAIERWGGDLRRILRLPTADAKKALREFPSIGEPGAEWILCAGGACPALAPESNGLRVLLRLGYGREERSYSATYRSVAAAVAPELGDDCARIALARLLLRRHGQEICRRARPECERCPIARSCDFYARRGRSTSRRKKTPG